MPQDKLRLSSPQAQLEMSFLPPLVGSIELLFQTLQLHGAVGVRVFYTSSATEGSPAEVLGGQSCRQLLQGPCKDVAGLRAR